MLTAEPRIDRRGRPYAAMMKPAYRRGSEPPNKGRKFPATVYTTREIQLILAGSGRGKAGARDRAIFTLMWRTGGRVNETTLLQLGDVDLDRRTVHFRFGKGSKGKGVKPRRVAMDQMCVDALKVWLAIRAELGVRRGTPLFCTITKGHVGHRVRPPVLRDKLLDIAAKQGLECRTHLHGLRHTCAVNMLEEGFTIREVQEQLGHSHMETTARYAGHLWPGELMRKMGARGAPGERLGGLDGERVPEGVDMAALAKLIAAEMRAGV